MNIKDKEENTPLFYVCKHGNYNFAKFLLYKGAIPNSVCSNGNTPMHMAF